MRCGAAGISSRTIWPSFMWMMRWQRAATSGACVTMTKVWPLAAVQVADEVHDLVGVLRYRGRRSARRPRRSRGSLTSARAIVTRWRWPPESCAGRCFAQSRRWTSSSALQAFARGPPALRAGDEQRQLDVLDGAEHRQQVVELEDEAHLAGAELRALVVGQLVDVLAVDEDQAAIDGVEAAQAVEERRLAAAGRAHDRDHLAARDAENDTPRSACTRRCRCGTS